MLITRLVLWVFVAFLFCEFEFLVCLFVGCFVFICSLILVVALFLCMFLVLTFNAGYVYCVVLLLCFLIGTAGFVCGRLFVFNLYFASLFGLSVSRSFADSLLLVSWLNWFSFVCLRFVGLSLLVEFL